MAWGEEVERRPPRRAGPVCAGSSRGQLRAAGAGWLPGLGCSLLSADELVCSSAVRIIAFYKVLGRIFFLLFFNWVVSFSMAFWHPFCVLGAGPLWVTCTVSSSSLGFGLPNAVFW